MTTWCANYLTITGPATSRSAFQKRAQGRDESGLVPLSFSGHVPEPVEFPGPAFYADHPDENVLFYGQMPEEPVGAPWRVANWGTTRDLEADSGVHVSDYSPAADEMALDYRFDTAWMPPLSWLERAGEAHPDLTFAMASHNITDLRAWTITISGGELTTYMEGDVDDLREGLEDAGVDLDWLEDV
jgi:hypothetical protein